MFDANMRHLPKGKKFYCKLHSCTKDSPLAVIGHHRGSVVFCEMLSVNHHNTCVKFWSEDRTNSVKLRPSWRHCHTYAVYEGSEGGTGFICEESKSIAMAQDAVHKDVMK